MLYNFSRSLLHEKEKAALADNFYINCLNAKEIYRYNHESLSDLAVQREDIDVSFQINGKKYNISEKFRDADYGDVYLEIYSKYPHKQGWIHTGSPDAIMYFTPTKVWWIGHHSLQYFCLNKLFPKISDQTLSDLYLSDMHSKRILITLDQQQVPVKLIKADNKDGAEWVTLGVAIPFKVLERNRVRLKRFSI